MYNKIYPATTPCIDQILANKGNLCHVFLPLLKKKNVAYISSQ